jgi:hypothetical protein
MMRTIIEDPGRAYRNLVRLRRSAPRGGGRRRLRDSERGDFGRFRAARSRWAAARRGKRRGLRAGYSAGPGAGAPWHRGAGAEGCRADGGAAGPRGVGQHAGRNADCNAGATRVGATLQPAGASRPEPAGVIHQGGSAGLRPGSR